MGRFALRRADAAALAALALLASAAGAAAVDCPAWRWANPVPQANTLHAVTAGDGVLVAVGEAGTLLVSADDGASWTVRDTGLDEALADVVWSGHDFVAVSTRHILTSVDGGHWQTFDPAPLLAAVPWGVSPDWTLRCAGASAATVNVSGSGQLMLRRDANDQWSLPHAGDGATLSRLLWTGARWLGVVDQWIGASSDADSWKWYDLRPYTLEGVAAGGGRLVAVGARYGVTAPTAVAVTSADGSHWTAHDLRSLGDWSTLKGVGFDGARFVGVGDDGLIATSPDGAAWTATGAAGTDTLSCVAATGATTVVVGDHGALLTSVDGVTWTSRRLGATQHLFAATAWPSGFVAVGGQGVALRSSDGRQWQSASTGVASTLLGVVWNGARLIAVGRDGAVVTSDDGSHWTPVSPPTTAHLFDVCRGDDMVVAVGTSGAILTSPEGLRWTSVGGVTTDTLYAVANGAGRFVAVGANGAVLTSDNGTAWTRADGGTTEWLYGLAWNGSTFVACGSTSAILTSSDGSSWSASTGAFSACQGIVWDGARFVMTDIDGRILTSPDGATWANERSPTVNSLNGLAVSAGVTIAVGTYGTVLRRECGPELRARRRLSSR